MTLVERSQIQADRGFVMSNMEKPEEFDPLYSINLKKTVAPILPPEEQDLLDRQHAGEDVFKDFVWQVVE